MSRYLCPSNPINWGHPLNRGLVSEWAVLPLGFGGITLFDIARRNHGTLTNGPTWSGARRPGGYGSLLFDGTDDFVTITNPINANAPYMIGGWWKTSTAAFRISFGLADSVGADGVWIGVNNTPGQATFNTAGGQLVTTTGLSLSDGNWHHVLGVWDGTNAIIYVDGSSQVSAARTGTSAVIATSTIGKFHTVSTYCWIGGLDGVVAYTRAPSASEVALLYEDSRRGNPSRWNYISNTTYFLPQLPLQTIGEIDFTSSVGKVLRRTGLDEVDVNWAHPSNQGLVGEWPVTQKGFGSSLLRDLTRKTDGALTNGPTWSGSRHLGGFGAVYLDGTDDQIVLGNTGLPDGDTALTIAFWINRTTQTSNYPMVVGKASSFNYNGLYYGVLIDDSGFSGNGSNIEWNVGGFTGNSLFSATTLSNNVWTHVLVTNDSTTQAIYINGKLDASQSGRTAPGANSANWRVGRWLASSGGMFNGMIDGLAIWRNRSFSTTAVADYYREQLLGNPTRWLRPNRSIVPVLQTIPTPSITMGATVQVRPVSSEVGINWGHPLNRGLVSEWSVQQKGFGGSRLIDLAGKNHGTLTNGPTWSGARKPGGSGSISFDGSNDRIAFTGLPSTTTTWTFAVWLYPNGGDNYQSVWSNAAGDTGIFHRSPGGAGGGKIDFYYSGASHLSNTGLTENAWNHIGVSVNAGSVTYYLNGQPNGTSSSAISFGPTNSGDDSGSESFLGLMDGWAYWVGRSLSDSEFFSFYDESLRGNPTRWLRRTTPHLPIVIPAPFVDTGGGTTYTQNVAGSVTATGSLAKVVMKALAGSSTAVGVLAKVALKPFAGSSTATGALTKQGNKALSGSSTSTGSLANAASKSLAGSSTTTGAIAKATSKSLTGSSTSTGALSNVKVALTTLTGSVTGAGTVAKQAGKGTSGSSSPSGGEVHAVSRSLAGSTTPTGAIAKQANKSVSGSAAPTGSMTTTSAATISLSGTVTAVGSFVKSVLKSLLGYVTSSGSLTTSGGTPGEVSNVGNIVYGRKSSSIVVGKKSNTVIDGRR